jgi:hypothetical protein
MRILFKDEESTILGRGGDGGGDGGGGTDAAGAPTGSAQAACNFGTDSQQAAYGGDQAVAGLAGTLGKGLAQIGLGILGNLATDAIKGAGGTPPNGPSPSAPGQTPSPPGSLPGMDPTPSPSTPGVTPGGGFVISYGWGQHESA